ncbi:MAG: GIY-YIG nuclease family protein [Allosphingosinicella sp.]
MMQFWVYILRCRDGSYYTGHTDNLDKRMAEHEQGLAADWTRRRRPVMLVWTEWTSSRYEALEFERRVKRWSRAKKEALIAGDWARVGYFAKPPHERPTISEFLVAANGLAPSLEAPPSTKFILSAAAGGVEGLGTNEVESGKVASIAAPAPHSWGSGRA